MVWRHQIKRRLSQPDALEYTSELLAGNEHTTRKQIARHLCDHFGFFDARGRRQMSGCLKAIRELGAQGHFTLPPPVSLSARHRNARGLQQPVPAARDVSDSVEKVDDLKLVLVQDQQHLAIWNELLIREHPQGAGPFVGHQLRYLIGSPFGWLGGLGFAAAALQLRDRDAWIGWDVETRRQYLDRVIGLSRMLIRPGVDCKNLASRVLGMAMSCVARDFEEVYGFAPWLVETFVDTERHDGACFRAANWIRVGRTQGRGRQDKDRDFPRSVKDIYVYALKADFRQRLGLGLERGRGPLKVTDLITEDVWAQTELANSRLGDKRLSNRLVQCAAAMGQDPMGSFPKVAAGDPALVKGYYRLIDQPDDSEVTPDNILAPHRQRTMQRMLNYRTVLCIQDGTGVNFNGLNVCTGLGIIGTNQTSAKSRGLELHSTLCVTTNGLPLGLLRSVAYTPVTKDADDNRASWQVPIEGKDLYQWILGLRDCIEVAATMPKTRLISVMDREADFFELFDEARVNPCVGLLVRAKHNRCTTDEHKLFDGIRAMAPQGHLEVIIERQSARPKKSKEKAKPKREARVAKVELRYQNTELKPPAHFSDREPIQLCLVHLVEPHPPEDTKPIEWFLLTTMEIATAEDAERCVSWYCLRWRIEDWHRVLKSGCKIEELGNHTAERLKRVVAINAVIAWRVMLMCLLGREVPDLPADLLFSQIEIKVLQAIAAKRRQPGPSRLGDAVRQTARLGGYIDRKRGPPPGHQVMWQGYTKLRMMSLGYELCEAMAVGAICGCSG